MEAPCYFCGVPKPCVCDTLMQYRKGMNSARWTCLVLAFFIALVGMCCAVLASERDVLQQQIERTDKICFPEKQAAPAASDVI